MRQRRVARLRRQHRRVIRVAGVVHELQTLTIDAKAWRAKSADLRAELHRKTSPALGNLAVPAGGVEAGQPAVAKRVRCDLMTGVDRGAKLRALPGIVQIFGDDE